MAVNTILVVYGTQITIAIHRSILGFTGLAYKSDENITAET
jgi:hypothetical protein